VNINIDISLCHFGGPGILLTIIPLIVFLCPLFSGLSVEINLDLLFLGNRRRLLRELGLNLVRPAKGELGRLLRGWGAGGRGVLCRGKWGGFLGGHDEGTGDIVDLLEALCVLVAIGEGGLGGLNRGLHVSHLGAEVWVSGVRVTSICFSSFG
jgi:hypothetical protein